jgi:hypothetical protein
VDTDKVSLGGSAGTGDESSDWAGFERRSVIAAEYRSSRAAAGLWARCIIRTS